MRDDRLWVGFGTTAYADLGQNRIVRCRPQSRSHPMVKTSSLWDEGGTACVELILLLVLRFARPYEKEGNGLATIH